MPLETIQLFLSNVFFLLLVQLYVRCSRLYHSRKSMAITFGLVIHPHQSVRVELYYCNNNFTKRAGLLNRSMYICESTGVHMYVRDYPYSSDSFDTIARENIAWRALSILRRILMWADSSLKLEILLSVLCLCARRCSILNVRRLLFK